MNDYNDIKNIWDDRTKSTIPQDGHLDIIKKGKQIQSKQLIARIVLGITIVVLIAFFIYISAYNSHRAALGLSLMIGSLIVRVFIELIYKLKSKTIEITSKVRDYNTKINKYYKYRYIINYVLTPILFVSYILGFAILLPILKSSLSKGFYNYVFYSSWVIFIILAVFIGYQIRKEMKNIKLLYSEDEEKLNN